MIKKIDVIGSNEYIIPAKHKPIIDCKLVNTLLYEMACCNCSCFKIKGRIEELVGENTDAITLLAIPIKNKITIFKVVLSLLNKISNADKAINIALM